MCVEDDAPRGYIFFTKECTLLLKFYGFFRFQSNCTINLVKTYLAYSHSLDVNWLAEGCHGYYPYNLATRGSRSASCHCTHRQRRASDGSFMSCSVWEISLMFGNAQLMTM